MSKIAHHFIWGSVMVNITLWNSEFPKNIKLAYLISVILKTYALEKKLIVKLSAFYLQFQIFLKD